MKKEDKVLTYEQARELRWFCQNVAGVQSDFYKVYDLCSKFEERINRLEATCDLIRNFFAEHNVKPPSEESIATTKDTHNG